MRTPHPVFLALALPLVLSHLGGCASTRVCNRTAAQALGSGDARRWDADQSNLRQAGTCTEKYTRADFARDYRAGFRQALGAQCRLDAAAAAGQQAASGSAQWQLDSRPLALCAEVGAPVNDLRQAYEQAYAQAFAETWCTTARAQHLAWQGAERLQPASLDWLAACPAERQQALASVYKGQYAQRLASACSAPAMASWGVMLARENGDLAQALAAVGACPGPMQPEAVAALQQSYDGEVQRLAMLREEQRRQQAIEQRTREHAEREEQRRVAASRREFVIEGKRVTLTCSVDDGRARVELFNHDHSYLSASGYITVESYDASGRPVDSTRTSALLSAGPGGMDDESVRVPNQAVGCLVRDVEFR